MDSRFNARKSKSITADNLGNAQQQQPSKEQAETTRLNILRQLIDDEILQQRAAKLHLVATDEEVNAKLAEMKAPYTQEEFDQRLRASGMTLDDLRRQIGRSLTSDKLMNKEVISRIDINDSDITNYYNANKAQFNFIEPKYNLAEIVVTSAPSEDAAGRQLAKQQSWQRCRCAQEDPDVAQPPGERRGLRQRSDELLGKSQ